MQRDVAAVEAEALKQRAQTAGVHRDVVDLALAECQRTAQKEEVGDRDLGQADIDADEFAAPEVQVDRVAASAHRKACMFDAVGIDRFHGAVVRRRPHQAAKELAAGIDFERDVAGTDRQHIAKAVGANLVGMQRQREEIFGGDRPQVGLEDAQTDIDVLHAEADEVALLRQRDREVRATDADEDIHVRRAEAQALEADTTEARIVVRQLADRLEPIDNLLRLVAEQGLDERQLARQPGVHRAGEGFAQAESEIAVEIDEVGDVEGDVGQLDESEYRDADIWQVADRQLKVVQEFQRTVEKVKTRQHVEHLGRQPRQFWQLDRRQQRAGLGQLESEIKTGIDLEEVEDAESGIERDMQQVGAEVELERLEVSDRQ